MHSNAVSLYLNYIIEIVFLVFDGQTHFMKLFYVSDFYKINGLYIVYNCALLLFIFAILSTMSFLSYSAPLSSFIQIFSLFLAKYHNTKTMHDFILIVCATILLFYTIFFKFSLSKSTPK